MRKADGELTIPSQPTAPPGGDFDDKRRRILAAAAEVFAERGFVAGTTKDIAARVGLSQPAIYHYVGSKEDLLHEIALGIDQTMRGVLEDSGSRDDPRAHLTEIVTRFTEAVVESQVPYTVYYKELHQLSQELRHQIAEDERLFVSHISEVVQELQASGYLPANAPPWVLAQGIVGMISWAHRWFRPSGPLQAGQIAAVFLDLIGLHQPPTR